VILQVTPDHLCTLVIPHRNENFTHRRKWEHRNPAAID
jgi:hypothetical protein